MKAAQQDPQSARFSQQQKIEVILPPTKDATRQKDAIQSRNDLSTFSDPVECKSAQGGEAFGDRVASERTYKGGSN